MPDFESLVSDSNEPNTSGDDPSTPGHDSVPPERVKFRNAATKIRAVQAVSNTSKIVAPETLHVFDTYAQVAAQSVKRVRNRLLHNNSLHTSECFLDLDG